MRQPRKLLSLPVAFILVMSVAVAGPLLRPPPAKAAATGICSLDPDPLSRAACEAGNKAVSTIPGVPNPEDVAASLAKSAGEKFMNWLTDQTAAGVAWLLKEEVKAVQATTTPQLTQPWFIREYRIVLYYGGVLAAIMLMIALADGVFKADVGSQLKAAARTIVFIYVTVSLPYVLMNVIDFFDTQVAPEILKPALHNFNQMQDNFSKGFTDTGIPMVLLLFLGILGIVGGFLTFVVLVLREVMIYLYTILLVIALALWVGGRGWAEWTNSTVKNLAGLALMNVYMALILLLGSGLLTNTDSFSSMVIGIVILFTLPVSTYVFYHKFQNIHTYNPSDIRRHATSGYGYVKGAAGKIITKQA